MKKTTIRLLIAALMHFIASIAAFLWSYTATADRFDGRHISWLSRHLAHPLHEFLWFPLGTLFAWSPYLRMWFYAGLALNSILWCTLILLVLRRLKNLRNGRARPPA